MSDSENTAMNSGNEKPTDHVPGELPKDLQSLEARLSALSPREDRLNRERIAFLAGQASVVATKERPISLLGMSVDAKMWPRAFAAMTVIAATLLMMLLTRPSIINDRSAIGYGEVTSGKRSTESWGQSIGESRSIKSEVLSAGDARGSDVERLLATRNEGAARGQSVDERIRPALTPAAWRQVMGDAELPSLPTDKSSNLPIDRGINS